MISSGAFLSITSTYKKGYSLEPIKLSSNAKNENSAILEYDLVSKALSMRHFRLVLELIDMCKHMTLIEASNKVVEFSPGIILERLGLKRCGASYTDLARMMNDLGEMKFESIDSLSLEDTQTLFSSIRTGTNSTVNGVTEDEDEAVRYWTFQISPFFASLINGDDLSSIHRNAFKDCGRSPLLQWLYVTYSTHGSDGKLIHPYRIRTLAHKSGLLQRLHITDKTKQKIDAASREIMYRVRQALLSLGKLKVFKLVELTPQQSINTYKKSFTAKIQRFKYKLEELLSVSNLDNRTSTLREYRDRPISLIEKAIKKIHLKA